MASAKEMMLLIKIAGRVDKTLNSSLNEAQASVNSTVKSINKFRTDMNKVDATFTKFDKGFDKVMRVGTKTFRVLSRASIAAVTTLGAVGVAAYNVGSDFESAFAGVKKTVDATSEEFAGLRQQIIDLSTEIPSTASEIAGVMEIAGQLGIANDSLADFTKTMINLGVSTNMTAEDASSALARFANITNMADFGPDGISNWERLGATIVDLGNNFATTEEEIVEMSYKLASTGSIVGLSEDQILGLATAMSSVGIKVEAGGSAMSKLLKKMQLAVETGIGALDDFASVAGMTGDEFAALFSEDATKALVPFIAGLNDTERNGKSAIAVLDEMGINEIRLSNMVLALANSSDLLTEALGTANTAWGEGNALAIEAGKRYETVESQASILTNTLKASGIAIYDGFREPIVETLSEATSGLSDFLDYVKGPDGVEAWANDLMTKLPTMKRVYSEYAEPVLGGVLNFGKWLVDNSSGVIGAIAGIGSVMASYKIASTTVHIVNALASLTLPSGIILGAIAAIGLLTASIVKANLAEKELVNNNLSEYFGDVTLSLSELQDVASKIISSEKLYGVYSIMEEFDGIDSVARQIQNVSKEIDKMNWKVGLGIGLATGEEASYKESISRYVKETLNYAEAAMYAEQTNLGMWITDQDVLEGVNRFYLDNYDELTRLGNELSDTVTEAFNDGILDIDEVNVIENLRRQMADIEAGLAASDFEASLSLLGTKYSGTITAEAFQNLQGELASQSAEAISAYESSYLKGYSALAASRNAGAITDAQFQSGVEELRTKLANEKASIELASAQFQMDTISAYYENAYGQAVSNAVSGSVSSDWSNGKTGSKSWWKMQENASDSVDIVQGGINTLLDNMAETFAGVLLAAENPYIDETTRNALLSVSGAASMLKNAYRNTDADLATAMLNGTPEQAAWISRYYGPQFNRYSYSHSGGGKRGTDINQYPGIGARARGGLISSPELSWIGEAGPEMVVPLDGSSRALSLWEQAGQLLSMRGNYDSLSLGGGSPSIVYSPTLQFYGDKPDRKDLEDALSTSQDEFDAMMDSYMKRNRRVSFV